MFRFENKFYQDLLLKYYIKEVLKIIKKISALLPCTYGRYLYSRNWEIVRLTQDEINGSP